MNKEGRIAIAGVGNCASSNVSRPLHEAVFVEPNCTTVFQPKLADIGVTVQMGPVLFIEGSAR